MCIRDRLEIVPLAGIIRHVDVCAFMLERITDQFGRFADEPWGDFLPIGTVSFRGVAVEGKLEVPKVDEDSGFHAKSVEIIQGAFLLLGGLIVDSLALSMCHKQHYLRDIIMRI